MKLQLDVLDVALTSLRTALADLGELQPKGAGELEDEHDHKQNEADRLKRALESAFRVGEEPGRSGGQKAYRDLPRAHGPKPVSLGIPTMQDALVRFPKYNAKFLPQEYSLLHKAWELFGGASDAGGIIDIGAGNANCAVLAASLLGLTVICVERESPPAEFRCEAHMPASLCGRVVRVESDIADLGFAALRDVCNAHGLRRVVIMAKHPCGIGVDLAIECAGRLLGSPSCCSQSKTLALGSPTVIGVVIATCCNHKMTPQVEDFCSMYAAEMPGRGALVSSDLRRDYAGSAAVPGTGSSTSIMTPPALLQVVELMCRFSAWRTVQGSAGNAIDPEQVVWAEVFEDAVNSLRIRRLQQLFGAAAQVRFAPTQCTLQDRCLIAGRAPLPPGIWANGEFCTDDGFISRIKSSVRALHAMGGPIDCRPRGVQSGKFDPDEAGQE